MKILSICVTIFGIILPYSVRGTEGVFVIPEYMNSVLSGADNDHSSEKLKERLKSWIQNHAPEFIIHGLCDVKRNQVVNNNMLLEKINYVTDCTDLTKIEGGLDTKSTAVNETEFSNNSKNFTIIIFLKKIEKYNDEIRSPKGVTDKKVSLEEMLTIEFSEQLRILKKFQESNPKLKIYAAGISPRREDITVRLCCLDNNKLKLLGYDDVVDYFMANNSAQEGLAVSYKVNFYGDPNNNRAGDILSDFEIVPVGEISVNDQLYVSDSYVSDSTLIKVVDDIHSPSQKYRKEIIESNKKINDDVDREIKSKKKRPMSENDRSIEQAGDLR
jgi:hypothetical protein